MKSILKIAYKTATTVLTVAVVLMAILLAGVRVVGLTPYTVLSGSMEPQYHVGSVIYVKNIDPTQLQENDPVTYRFENGTVVTHRIIEVIQDENGLSFRTKGDANQDADGGLLTASRVIGKPVFSIPYLGFISHFIQTPPGSYCAIGVCGLLFISVLVDMLFPGKEKSAEDEQIPQDDRPE